MLIGSFVIVDSWTRCSAKIHASTAVHIASEKLFNLASISPQQCFGSLNIFFNVTALFGFIIVAE